MSYPSTCCGQVLSTLLVCGTFEAPTIADQGACFPYRLLRDCEAPTVAVLDEVVTITWDVNDDPIYTIGQP